MRSTAVCLVSTVALCTAPPVHAEPAPAEPAPDARPAQPAPDARPAGPAPSRDVPLAARRALELAADAWARGDRAAARAHFDTARGVVGPGHWLETVIDKLHDALDQGAPLPPSAAPPGAPSPRPPPTRPRPDSRDPRAEADSETLATTYVHVGAFGVWTGAYLFGAVMELDEDVVVPLSFLTGAAGALGVYALDASEPLRGGTAAGLDAGLQLGTLWGLLGHFVADGDDAATAVWASGAVGGLAGGLGAHFAGASRGDVALVHSGGLWGAILGSLAGVALDVHDDREYAATVLATSAAGAAGMALLSTRVKMSRARVLFMDLGGLGGMLGGLAAASVVGSGDTLRDEAVAGMVAGGALVGLGFAAVATRDLDGPLPAVTLAPALLDGGVDDQGRRALAPGLLGAYVF